MIKHMNSRRKKIIYKKIWGIHPNLNKFYFCILLKHFVKEDKVFFTCK
ncbi:hypothetical protein A0O32_2188 [Anoxybacillus flavithermus]|nr:hypothetical protein A0O32_2188 [Anoxybacillus flavithermus]